MDPFDQPSVVDTIVSFLSTIRDIIVASQVDTRFRDAVLHSKRLRWRVLYNWPRFYIASWRSRYLANILTRRHACRYIEWLVDALCEQDALWCLTPREALMLALAVSRLYDVSTNATVIWATRVSIQPRLDRIKQAYPFVEVHSLIRSADEMSEHCKFHASYAWAHHEVIWDDQSRALHPRSLATATTTDEVLEICNPDHTTSTNVQEHIFHFIFLGETTRLEHQLVECARHACTIHPEALFVLRLDAIRLIQGLWKAFGCGDYMVHRLMCLYTHFYPRASIRDDLLVCGSVTTSQEMTLECIARTLVCGGFSADGFYLLNIAQITGFMLFDDRHQFKRRLAN